LGTRGVERFGMTSNVDQAFHRFAILLQKRRLKD